MPPGVQLGGALRGTTSLALVVSSGSADCWPPSLEPRTLCGQVGEGVPLLSPWLSAEVPGPVTQRGRSPRAWPVPGVCSGVWWGLLAPPQPGDTEHTAAFASMGAAMWLVSTDSDWRCDGHSSCSPCLQPECAGAHRTRGPPPEPMRPSNLPLLSLEGPVDSTALNLRDPVDPPAAGPHTVIPACRTMRTPQPVGPRGPLS